MRIINKNNLLQKIISGGLLLGLVVSMTLPAAAMSISSGGIGGRTTKIDPDNPRTQSIFIHEVDRGQTATDQVLVVNGTQETKTVQLMSVDGAVANNGAYACRENAEEVKASGAWVKLAKTEVTLPAGGEEKVDFTIAVPDKADVGEHNSCITFVDKHADANAEGGIILRMRQAIRVVVTVPGEMKRDLSVESFKLTELTADDRANGTQRFEIAVNNKGNVSADTNIKVRIKSLFNKDVTQTGGEYVILPETTLEQQLQAELKPMFGGWYRAESSISYDKRLGVFGTQKAVELEEKAGPSITIFLWPTTAGWIVIGLTILVIAVGVVMLALRRRRQEEMNRYVARYKVKPGDMLVPLSEKAGYDWKAIVKLNNLKPPYDLEPGQILKVPISEDKLRAKKDKTKTTKE